MNRILIVIAAVIAMIGLTSCAQVFDFSDAIQCASAQRSPGVWSPPKKVCAKLTRQGLVR